MIDAMDALKFATIIKLKAWNEWNYKVSSERQNKNQKSSAENKY